jgi:hypothetical protein
LNVPGDMHLFRRFNRRPLVAGLLMGAVSLSCELKERISCQSDIVSSTVVATFCGHRQGASEMLDLLIVWRGAPGWFHNRPLGRSGGGGYNRFGAGTNGHVAMHQFYGNVTINFEVDFDANSVTIGDRTVALGGINTIRVDNVDEPGVHKISARRWTAPRLPLGGDVNLMLAQRSRALLSDLQCEIPMPAPPSQIPQPTVITVCEKLKPQ